ncbi:MULTISPECIES: vWA domain-containing protein [Galbibacter]|uniref:VWA domain-containing protein n=1 Tax=Galbibacter pacificus TaxID=2996052 RepID=A0ABT6FQP3_9FLAO|nr:VWA domain-containing protein [Galbibacter pacificus]MDG3581960.1 VWA domain-containing protein [Galbibacter pacificus]MDG3585566.1 VWA domain-containing protein [Galbibacter pacificus]
MKLFKTILSVLCIVTMFTACGSSDDDFASGPDVDDCLGLGDPQLKLSIQDTYTTLPGKVSVFFKVNTLEGEPVSNLTANNFSIYEKGRNDNCYKPISPSESNGRISPNSQIFNTNTLLVLDLSNSVLSSSLEELKTASVSFVEEVMPATPDEKFKMAIYWFDGSDELHELNALTSDRAALTTAIDSITSDISQDPSTDLYGAVIKSTDIATGILQENEELDILAASSVVVFTDGTDQAARYSESDAINKVKNADENISFFTIGLGNEIDENVLTQIGKTGSAFASNKEELEDTFQDISENVAGQANSYYLFEYCSPKRDGSGVNQLVIQAKRGEEQGAIQTEFDATGFTGGCK